MLWIIVIVLTIIVIFLSYSLLPTFLMRAFSWGVFNRSTAEGQVALTFDDGPDPRYTPQLLDILKRYEAKATFFVIGEFAEMHPEILKRMENEGHTIGIHHYRHTSNWLALPGKTKRECQQTAAIIEGITGKRPLFYRPPWGHLNVFVYWSARPFHLVLWSAILGDWNLKLGKERLTRRLHQSLRNGAIIVLHDSNQTPGADEGASGIMLKALEGFLDDVYDQYDFVTIDTLYQHEHPEIKM